MADPASHTAQVERLLAELRAGDAAAQERLVEQACQRLRALSSRMLGRFPGVHRWEETDDVLIEALTRLHRSLASVRPESARHFYNLAATHIRRVLVDLARKHSGPQGLGANLDTNVISSASVATGRAERAATDGAEPANLAEWAEFHELIERLPAAEREVFSLLWYDGLTQEEAAELLGVSVRSIKRRWQSARLLIAQAMPGGGLA